MTGGAPDGENILLTGPGERFGARLQGNSSSAALQARIMEQEAQNLREAFSLLGAEGSVVRAAAVIVAARRRFLAGAGKSFAYANLLAADLSAGLSQVTVVDGTTVRALDVLADVRTTDVLVAFSFRRYRRDTISLGAEFVRRGGRLVVITDDAGSPLAGAATVAVVVPTASASFADSPTAVAAATHLLGTLTIASSKGARRRLAERDRISSALELYVDTSPGQRSPS